MDRSQSARILDYLATSHTLTPLQALRKFNCFRLSARIYDLRADGHRIDSRFAEVGTRKKVKIYWLKR
jgi:hypothetical protein